MVSSLTSLIRYKNNNINLEDNTNFLKKDNLIKNYKIILAITVNDIELINELKISNLTVELEHIDIELKSLLNQESPEYKIFMELKKSNIHNKEDLGMLILHAYKISYLHNNMIKIPTINDLHNSIMYEIFIRYIKIYLFDTYATNILNIRRNLRQNKGLNIQEGIKEISDILLNFSTDKLMDIENKYMRVIHSSNRSSLVNKINYIYDIYSSNNLNFSSIEELASYVNIFDEFFRLYFNYIDLIEKYINNSNDKISKKLIEINKDLKNNSNNLILIELAFASYCRRKKIYNENKSMIDFNVIGSIEKLKKLYKLSNKIVYLMNIKDNELYHSFNSELVDNIKKGLSLPDRVLSKKNNSDVVDQLKIAMKKVVPRITYDLNLEFQMLLVVQTLKVTGDFYELDKINKFLVNGVVPVVTRGFLEQLFLKYNVFNITPYKQRNSNNLIKKNKNKLLKILKQIDNNHYLNPEELLSVLEEIKEHYLPEWFNRITLVYGKKRFTLNMIFFELLNKLEDESLIKNLNIKKCSSQSTIFGPNNLDDDTELVGLNTKDSLVKCKNTLDSLVKTYKFDNVSYDQLKAMLLKINEQLSFPNIDRINIIDLIYNFKLMLDEYAKGSKNQQELEQIEKLKQIYCYCINKLNKKIVDRNNYLINVVQFVVYVFAAILDNFISIINTLINLITNSFISIIYSDSIEYMDDHVRSYLKRNKTITNNTIAYISDLIKSISINQNVDLWSGKTNEEIIEIKKQLIKKDPDFINIFIDNNIVKEILNSEDESVSFMTKEQMYEYYLKLSNEEIQLLKSGNDSDVNNKIAIFNKIYNKIFLEEFNKDIILDLIKNEPNKDLKKYFIYCIVKEIEVGKTDKKSRMGKLREKNWRKYLIRAIATFVFSLTSAIIFSMTGGLAIVGFIALNYGLIAVIKEVFLYQLDLKDYNKKVKPILEDLQEIYSPDKKNCIKSIKINSIILKNYCKSYLGDINNLGSNEISDKIINFLAENASSKALLIQKLKVCLDVCDECLSKESYEQLLYSLKDKLLNIENDLGVLDIINRNDHTLLFIAAKILLKSIISGVLFYLSFIKIIINDHTLNILGLAAIVLFLKGFLYWFRNRFYNFFKVRSITSKKIKIHLDKRLQTLYTNLKPNYNKDSKKHPDDFFNNDTPEINFVFG